MISKLGENNNTNCNGNANTPNAMSEKYRMTNSLPGLALSFCSNNFVNKQRLVVTITIAVKTENSLSIARSIL